MAGRDAKGRKNGRSGSLSSKRGVEKCISDGRGPGEIPRACPRLGPSHQEWSAKVRYLATVEEGFKPLILLQLCSCFLDGSFQVVMVRKLLGEVCFKKPDLKNY